MARIYYDRIVSGKMTFNEVPKLFQDKTLAYFRERVEDGTITPAQYEQYTGHEYETPKKRSKK